MNFTPSELNLEETLLEPMAEISRLLTGKEQTVCTAESCTAGLIAYAFTSIPGSSDYFRQGWVLYQELSKRKTFDMPPKIDVYSEDCAIYLAKTARLRSKANWGIGITGQVDKNRCWIGFSGDGLTKCVFDNTFIGIRAEVRKQMVIRTVLAFKDILNSH